MAKIFGDLSETVMQAQAESNDELVSDKSVDTAIDTPAEVPPISEVAPDAAPEHIGVDLGGESVTVEATITVPRYSGDGVLLNPDECIVHADGTVTGKVV